MPRLDLTASARRQPIDASQLPELTDAERTLAIETWRGRMLNEHASAQVFASLIPQLMRAEISAERQQQVADMVSEEFRHARECAAVVEALGGEAVGELPDILPLPNHGGVLPLEALLRNVLSICCLSETVAVSLINAERLQLEDSVLSEVLRRILADEIGHARFGWKLLEELDLDADLKKRLGNYLVVAFEHLVEHELAHLSPLPAPTAACAAAGVCDGALARSIFFETVETIIVERLEQHGIEARAAWDKVHAKWARTSKPSERNSTPSIAASSMLSPSVTASSTASVL